MKVKLLGREWGVQIQGLCGEHWWQLRSGAFNLLQSNDSFDRRDDARADLLKFVKENGGELIDE